MEQFYPLLTVASMAGFGWLGWRLAGARNRNPLGWLAAGAVFPPLLLILAFLAPVPAEDDTDESGPG
jgi:amino acid transporter